MSTSHRPLRAPRQAATDALVALAILAPFMAWGCGSSSGTAPSSQPVSAPTPAPTPPAAPVTLHTYPSSFVVPDVPPGSWVRPDVYVCAAAVTSFGGALGLAEVDATEASRDARIAWPSTATAGLPASWRLVVMPPGSFTVYRDGLTAATLGGDLGAGITVYGQRTIYASGPNRPKSGPILRVLAHELGHAHLSALGYSLRVADANDHPLTPVP